MNWPTIIVAMLPEHLLLAGIVVLLASRSRGARRAKRMPFHSRP